MADKRKQVGLVLLVAVLGMVACKPKVGDSCKADDNDVWRENGGNALKCLDGGGQRPVPRTNGVYC